MVIVFCLSVSGQVGKSNEETSLQGLTEAVIVDGQPALKILSRRKRGETQIKFEQRDGNDALVFDVVKMSVKNPVGRLFITKEKIIFVSYDNDKIYLDLTKSRLKNVKERNSLEKFPFVHLQFDKDEAKFKIKFDKYEYLIDRESMHAAHGFLYRAIDDFDSAVSEFKTLTARAR